MVGRPRPIRRSDAPLFVPGRDRTVALVLLSGIGDVVHGLPLANDLRALDPTARLLWVAEPAPAQVLLHHPAVDRVVTYPPRSGWSGLRALARDLRGAHADLALNAQRYAKSLWPTVLSGASRRVGLAPSKTRDGIGFFHTHLLPEGPWKHTQDLFLDFRIALGVPEDAPISWGIRFSDEERAAQRAFFGPLVGQRTVGLVLTSAHAAKDWPADRYAALAQELEGSLDYRVVLVGGNSPAERRAAAIVAGAAPTLVDGTGDGVRRMMWMVDGCDLLIAPDTGPLHIAHALGTPVIGLFGHTNPWRVGPYTRFRDLVIDRYTEPGEQPDPAGYEPKAHRMERIRVHDVLEKVETAGSLLG